MAKFQFNCPQCGQTVKADETWSGRDGECPCCGKAIVVPCNHVHSDIVRKGGEGKQILTRAKSAVIMAKNKVVTLWKSGRKGVVILCVPALLALATIVSLTYFMTADHGNTEAQFQSGPNDALTQSSWCQPTLYKVPPSQTWDIESLRKVHSKPMSADQEVYNNLLYLYLSMQGNYSKYKDIKKTVYEFDHTKLSQDMKVFVSGFVSVLDKIGEIERRIDNCQDDRERERNDSSFASGFSGGFKAASTLSQFDSGGDDGFGAGTYLLAGLIGGLVETSNNDTRINEKYKRIVQEYREQEEGLYIGFRQDINKLRSSETFNAFDKVRLLFDDAISVVKNVDSDKARQLVQCKVPELALAASSQLISMEHPDETKKYIVDCIANYPQSLASPRKTDVSACYSFLATVVFQEKVVNKFHCNMTYDKVIESVPPAEFAALAADPIAILEEAIKNDSLNDYAFSSRASFRWGIGDCNGALTDVNNAIRINPDKSYFYAKACILAKGLKDAPSSKAAIREAFKKGFCDIKKLKADKDLVILHNDPEFLEMTKVKFRWWYERGIMYSEIFLKNESCFRLTSVRLVSSSSSWRWSLPESGTVTLEPGETFSKDWYDNPPSYAQTSAEISCDQN